MDRPKHPLAPHGPLTERQARWEEAAAEAEAKGNEFGASFFHLIAQPSPAEGGSES